MSLLTRLILIHPERVRARLARAEALGLVRRAPTPWQVCLGILRMWVRVLTRPETIGGCVDDAVRATWRARLLRFKAARFFALTWERAIAPLDFSGLLAGRERILRHLLSAHHDGRQFAYDFELLRLHDEPGAEPALVELERRAAAVVDGRDPQAPWLRDLVVYAHYHERLLDAVRRALAGEALLPPEEAADPDISLLAYLRWCAAQPTHPGASWRAWRQGALDLSPGPRAPQEL